MNWQGWAEIADAGILVTFALPLGIYLARVWQGRAHLARPGAEARRARSSTHWLGINPKGSELVGYAGAFLAFTCRQLRGRST